MDLERVEAVIRPRSPWEAVDLGFGMVRAWWRPIWAAWLTTVAPAWWLVFGLTWLATGLPGVALFVVWWLRPLLDRVPLYIVSRHLFGASPSVRDVLADLRRLWTRHLGAALTLQRLDPARSFDLPVWELEGLRGEERRLRTAVLQRAGRSHAVWLTLACSLLEIFTMLACFELATFLSPSSGWIDPAAWEDLGAEDGELTTAFWWWTAAVSFLALTVIEPFYVAGGFSLYLSRRIHLEGWDVEIAFRRLAARLTGGGDARRKGGKAAVVVLVVLLGTGGAWGDPETSTKAAQADPAKAIQQILDEPELQTHKKMKVWRYKGDTAEPEPPQGDGIDLSGVSLGFLRPLMLAVALVLLVGLAAVAVQGFRRRPRPVEDDDEHPRREPLPAAVFGLDIRPESLPDDVPGAAWSAWEKGEPDRALGLLYRAAIAFLVRREGLPVRESWTEGDCVAYVRRKTGAERAQLFDRLTRAWQSTAYAHRPPAAGEVRALCDAWGRHFGGAA